MMRTVPVGLVAVCFGLGGAGADAQTSSGTGLPSGFTAPGLPFGPTSTVSTVASPTPTMAIANPGGLSFGGASGSGAVGPGLGSTAGGLRFGGASTGTASSGAGSGAGGGAGTALRRPLDDVTGSIGSGGGGGAPAGAGIAGAGASRRPTDAYFDPLVGSGFR
ncbi:MULTISPECIES: 1,3-beta-glucanase [unclassified Methylobacterium]|uniref:1,3-beta-glucanase n=1 Tax=unclassified Methylobacterium TaxID=2615210 RepID=UPI0036F935AA